MFNLGTDSRWRKRRPRKDRPGGAVVELKQDEIVEKTRQAASAMPNGLIQLMTADEVVDLVEYLTTPSCTYQPDALAAGSVPVRHANEDV